MTSPALTATRPAPYFLVHVFHSEVGPVLGLLRTAVADRPRYPQRGVDENMAAAKMLTEQLLSQPVERLRTISAFQPHMPYCVAGMLPVPVTTIVVLRDPVERVVTHVRKLATRLGTNDLAAVYHDPTWHDWWMADHQTRALSLTPDECDAWDTHSRRLLATANDGDRGPAVPMDDQRVARAMRNLEATAVVGTTDRFDLLLESLRSTLGWDVPTTIGAPAYEVPHDELVATVRQDNQLDLRLVEFARGLALQRAIATDA